MPAPNQLFTLRIALVAALGGLLFGFDTAVISGTTEWLQRVFGLSDAGLGFTVASALLGTIVGALAVGVPADRIGRRDMLIVIAVLYFVSAVGTALPHDWYTFLFFRFVGGLGVGGASVVAPMYIAEISPAASRGRFVALTQFNIVLGVLLAFLSNYAISRLDLGPAEWRWMFGVEAVPAAVFFGLLFLNPRSPRWLCAKGRDDEARAVMSRLVPDPAARDRELAEIRGSLDRERHGVREPLFSRAFLVPLGLACTIAVFNQLSGINALLYYAPKIFKLTGAAGESALFQSVIIGLVNLVCTMAAVAVIDRFGRRKLMLIGSVGYILSLGTAAAVFFANGADFSPAGGLALLGALVLFIAAHAVGQGAVIWVFISEIFPNRVRSRGLAVASFTLWAANAAIAQLFPVVLGALGGGPVFAIFCGFMILQLLWVILVMPETKGISLEAIQERLQGRSRPAGPGLPRGSRTP